MQGTILEQRRTVLVCLSASQALHFRTITQRKHRTYIEAAGITEVRIAKMAPGFFCQTLHDAELNFSQGFQFKSVQVILNVF